MVRQFLLLTFLLVSYNGLAQLYDKQYEISPSDLIHTSYYNLMQADSFSAKGDSINASICFLQIDPYYLLGFNATPVNIDNFFDVLLTRDARKKLKDKLTKAYNAPKSVAYNTFRKMAEEDQAIRKLLESCKDSACRVATTRKMLRADSVHFRYLHDYVLKKGWPALVDGSYYTEILEMHDAAHWIEHLPLLKYAVLKGDFQLQTYLSVLNRSFRPSFEQLLERFTNKFEFDISECLAGKQPSKETMEAIHKAVLAHCPVKYQYYVYSGNSEKVYRNFMSGNDEYWIVWCKILAEVSKWHRESCNQLGDIPYDFKYLHSESPRKTLKLYLIY